MKYQVYIEKRILKSLGKIQEEDREKILKNITNLENNPRPFGSKKLTGRDG